ncbi:MAG: C39 family peptidase [Candidatus Riflebacteria bacterium]|nr:C39 family peptidase [Candidatus Riflebacteria bacterium]
MSKVGLAILMAAVLAAASVSAQPDPGITILGEEYAGVAPVSKPQVPPKGAGQVGIVDVFTRLNVRDGPGLQYSVIGKLNPGDPVVIVGQQGDWLQIQWNGRLAWICEYYVWTPGKGVRNSAIVSTIRSQFGSVPLTERGSGLWSGETGQTQSQQGNETLPPLAGPQVGNRLADGGLAVPLYNQNACGARYPGGFCGPTSLKMVLEYFGIRKDVNYLGLRSVNGAVNVYTPGEGSSSEGMTQMLRHVGMQNSFVKEGCSLSWLRQVTGAGYPVIANVAGYYGGGNSSAGHYVVVAGVTDDGRVVLCNSAGGRRQVVDGSDFLNGWRNRDCRAVVAKP